MSGVILFSADSQTGLRDLNLPQTLMRSYGHSDYGVYAGVIEGGEVAAGDEIAIA